MFTGKRLIDTFRPDQVDFAFDINGFPICPAADLELIDTGFRKESGVISKRYVTIPYDRIQNVNIDRGIMARILGLSDLSIETAGFSAIQMRRGYSAEGRLPGLSTEVAEQLRDELVKRAHQSKNQGL